MTADFTQEMKEQIILRLEENLPRVKKCCFMLDEEQIWIKFNENSNSVANLMLHLCGNIRQYVMHGAGGQVDVRQRDLEFSQHKTMDRAALWDTFESTIREAVLVVKGLSEKDMLEKKRVQVYDLSVIGVLVHVTEHLSYHVGQISLITKYLLNQDLGYYADVEL